MSRHFRNRMLPIIAVSLFLVGASNASGQAPSPAAGAAPATPRADVPPGPPQPVEPGYLGLVTDATSPPRRSARDWSARHLFPQRPRRPLGGRRINPRTRRPV